MLPQEDRQLLAADVSTAPKRRATKGLKAWSATRQDAGVSKGSLRRQRQPPTQSTNGNSPRGPEAPQALQPPELRATSWMRSPASQQHPPLRSPVSGSPPAGTYHCCYQPSGEAEHVNLRYSPTCSWRARPPPDPHRHTLYHADSGHGGPPGCLCASPALWRAVSLTELCQGATGP